MCDLSYLSIAHITMLHWRSQVHPCKSVLIPITIPCCIQNVIERESCLQVILFWGVGGGVGVIGGGFFGQWLYNRKAFLMPIFVGVCACGASFPIWFLLNANLQRVHYFFSFAAAFLGGMLSSPPGPNAR